MLFIFITGTLLHLLHVMYVKGAGPNRPVQEESGRDKEDLQEEY